MCLDAADIVPAKEALDRFTVGQLPATTLDSFSRRTLDAAVRKLLSQRLLSRSNPNPIAASATHQVTVANFSVKSTAHVQLL
jgi:hypothetical protein